MHYDNRHFIIDLNRNKLTYIFPILNYFTRQKLIEISEDDKGNIKRSRMSETDKKEGNKKALFGAGIGSFFGVLGRPFVDVMDFKSNLLLNIFLVLITVISLIFIKILVDRKKRIYFTEAECVAYAFILPKIKYVVLNIFIYILFMFLLTMTCIATITLEVSSPLYIFGIIVFLGFILRQYVLIYDKIKTKGRIGGIKWKQ